MNADEAITILKYTKKLNILTRTVKYDKHGKIISDTITNHLTGETYQTPERKEK